MAQPSPAPSTSPYENPPQATRPLNRSSRVRPAIRSVMCTSDGSEAGAIEHRRHLDLTVDALLAQDRDLGPRAARDVRRGNILGRIERQLREQARDPCGSSVRCALFLGARRVVAQRLHADSSSRTRPRATRVRDASSSNCPSHRAIATRSPVVDRSRSRARTRPRPAVASTAPHFDRCERLAPGCTAPSSSVNSSATAPHGHRAAAATSRPQ